MILGPGVKLKYRGGGAFSDATFSEYPRGLHTAALPMLQAQRCCEFDHILASLRALPLVIERRPPCPSDVWFELRLLRWEHLGRTGSGMETCIRLVPFGLATHFTVRTIPGQQLVGLVDPIGSQGFAYEPEFTYLRLEVWYNKFGHEANAPLRLRHGHAVRWYNGQPCGDASTYARAA